MRHIERWFWLVCLGAIGLGFALPGVGRPLAPFSRYFLMGILFFTCLKISWHEVLGHLQEPLFIAYVTAMVLVVLPIGMWGAAQLLLPSFTLGVVILAAMPAGMAGSSLTQVAGGNAALALVVTAATTLLAPVTVPLMVRWLGGEAVERGSRVLLAQAGWLGAILFTPAVLAAVVRRLLPGWVERHKADFTGLSIISLGVLIFSIMAPTAPQALAMVRSTPWRAVGLLAFTVFFSASLHLSAFAWAFWRPWPDRVGISVNAAYVNNGLALVFAREFFSQGGAVMPEAVLPAIAVEIPMVLAILPLQWYAGRRRRREATVQAV